MGFSAGNYAKIKEVVDKKDNYTTCKVTISKKNKATNKYELTFSGYVKFVGNAHKSVPIADQRIKLVSCDVTNCYTTQDGGIGYNKNPQFVCFEYELQESQGASPSVPQFGGYTNPVNFEDLSSSDSDLPF